MMMVEQAHTALKSGLELIHDLNHMQHSRENAALCIGLDHVMYSECSFICITVKLVLCLQM